MIKKDFGQVWLMHNNLRQFAKINGFTTGNILGEYTEFLCSERLGLELITNNNQGYDAIDKNNAKVQIKGRQIIKGNSAKLTTLWNVDFDYIIAVIFNDMGHVYFAQKIPVSTVIKKTKMDFKKNCRRYVANIKDSGNDGIEDLTSLFE